MSQVPFQPGTQFSSGFSGNNQFTTNNAGNGDFNCTPSGTTMIIKGPFQKLSDLCGIFDKAMFGHKYFVRLINQDPMRNLPKLKGDKTEFEKIIAFLKQHELDLKINNITYTTKPNVVNTVDLNQKFKRADYSIGDESQKREPLLLEVSEEPIPMEDGDNCYLDVATLPGPIDSATDLIDAVKSIKNACWQIDVLIIPPLQIETNLDQNNNFVEKAPTELIDQEKTNFNNLEKDVKKIQLTLENL